MSETRRVVARVSKERVEPDQEFSFSLDDRLPADLPAGLRAYRQKAWETYTALPFPRKNNESWRRTDLRELKPARFHLQPVQPASSGEDWLNSRSRCTPSQEMAGWVVTNGTNLEIQLIPGLKEAGVVLTDFRSAAAAHPGLLEKHLGKIVSLDGNKFTALAGSLTENGILLYIPRDLKVDLPFSVVQCIGEEMAAHFSHVLVVLEEGASATFQVEWTSPAHFNGEAFHAGILETVVGAGAHLNLVELQSLGAGVWNFIQERVVVERDGEVDWVFGNTGSRVTKAFSALDLTGQGSKGKMSGFYITSKKQHIDLDTHQNHLAPSTSSDFMYKGVLLDSSRSVWKGMVYVAPNATKTDGYQANRNLVLSDQARADSIPGLEILTDDVRCSHGATVGKIDKDQVFYLRTRGLPEKEAERLIVEGFLEPILERIPLEDVQNRFHKELKLKLQSGL